MDTFVATTFNAEKSNFNRFLWFLVFDTKLCQNSLGLIIDHVSKTVIYNMVILRQTNKIIFIKSRNLEKIPPKSEPG